jgi:hypothetical protein
MHHQTDTLHPSEFFSIFPTCVGMFDLTGYHPAEEPKVFDLINKDSVEENVLDTLPLLKKSINDCIKSYTNEYSVEYHEVADSYYENIESGKGVDSKSFDNSLFIGHYFPTAQKESIDLIVEAPFNNPISTPVEKSLSLYTAPSEKFIIDKGRLIITPAHLARHITPNKLDHAVNMITFTTKVVSNDKITFND